MAVERKLEWACLMNRQSHSSAASRFCSKAMSPPSCFSLKTLPPPASSWHDTASKAAADGVCATLMFSSAWDIPASFSACSLPELCLHLHGYCWDCCCAKPWQRNGPVGAAMEGADTPRPPAPAGFGKPALHPQHRHAPGSVGCTELVYSPDSPHGCIQDQACSWREPAHGNSVEPCQAAAAEALAPEAIFYA